MKRALAVLALAACKSPPPAVVADQPGDCLALPGASRTNLTADPKGGGLYWFEPVPMFDFNSDGKPYYNLVRYDLAARRLDILANYVAAPLHVLGDKIVVPRSNKHLTLVNRAGGQIQELLPDYLTAVDVEPLDDHTVAVLADGDGPRAVYTIDLDRPRPHHMIDASTILSTWGGRMFVYVDQDLVQVELDGRTKILPLPSDTSHPQGPDVYDVKDSSVHGHRMTTPNDHEVIGDRRRWKLVNQSGSVLARSPPEADTSYAYLISGGSAKPLATVTGGASIVGATQLGGQTWALIGHNTVNYIGDLGDTDGETEVCLLPPTGTIKFETRVFPKRYAAKTKLLQAAMPEATGMQLLQDYNAAITLYVDVKESSNDDFDAMRERARAVQAKVTSLLGDREIRTVVHYPDDRVGMLRWKRDRLRVRASAGMGDALMSDPIDFDVEVKGLVNRREKAKILCSGTLTNTQPRALEHLQVRCIAGNRHRVIAIPQIAPHATMTFNQSFDVDADDGPFFEIVSGREPLEIRTFELEAHMLGVFRIAAAVRDETQLTLEEHKPGPPLTVKVSAPGSFAKKSEADLEDIARKAYTRFLAIPAVYGLAPEPSFTLTISIELGKTYKFDGTELTPAE